MKKVAGVYLLGGITLVSEIALPELPLIQQPERHAASGEHSTWATCPAICPAPSSSIPIALPPPRNIFCAFQGIARYLVSDGREIVVSPEAGALPLDVRAYLLGTLFVVLCQQRGLLPLHASAVGSGKGVVAFLARSGQGKSSLAAHLAQRGFRVVADDVCLIDHPDGSGHGDPRRSMAEALAQLFAESGKASGRTGASFQRGRQVSPAAPERRSQPEPIRKLVFLEADEGSVTEYARGIRHRGNSVVDESYPSGLRVGGDRSASGKLSALQPGVVAGQGVPTDPSLGPAHIWSPRWTHWRNSCSRIDDAHREKVVRDGEARLDIAAHHGAISHFNPGVSLKLIRLARDAIEELARNVAAAKHEVRGQALRETHKGERGVTHHSVD